MILKDAITNPGALRAKALSQWKVPILAGLVASACFWLLWIYLSVLGYKFLQSDELGYWNASLDWQHGSFDVFHPPAYPLVIALIRTLTLGIFPPAVLMTGITFVFMLVSALLVYKLLR